MVSTFVALCRSMTVVIGCIDLSRRRASSIGVIGHAIISFDSNTFAEALAGTQINSR